MTTANLDEIKYISQSTLSGMSNTDDSDITFVEANDVFNGPWVASVTQLASTSGTVNGTSYSLSNYLPNDNKNYLVRVQMTGYDDDSTYAYHVNSDIFSTGSTDTAINNSNNFNHIHGGTYSRQNISIFDIPVGSGRYLKLYGSGADAIYINLQGYSRLGKNV